MKNEGTRPMALDERQKTAIERMRRCGCGYKTIALTLALSRDSVRALLKNSDTTTPKTGGVGESGRWCRWCGRLLKERQDGKKPKFCCESHRRAFWRANPHLGTKKAIYRFTCPTCHAFFEAYGNKDRTYCSHPCYIKARFGTRGGK